MLCDTNCPQYQGKRKKNNGRCTLQDINMVYGEECSLLKKFLPITISERAKNIFED
jgi:hypothetical protein